jgi:hypothetical protein
MSTETQPIDAVKQTEQIRDEWITAVDHLYREVEGWAKVQGWTTKRRPVVLEEKRLGRYEVWKLTVRTNEGPIRLLPVARYVIGAMGRVDLVAPPARDPSQMICRSDDGSWQIHPFGDSEIATPWSEEKLVELTKTLIRSVD